MLIKKIIIRGAIGIKKGLGLEEIEIDFTNKTGLIALAGPNGKGKTTILELMSPYRTFASRKGALNHHFCLRDSFIETWFEFNGDQYRTIKKIDSGSDRAESFIYINNNTESETDGKNKEYDKYILNLFGSPVLFYNSVFCAQNSKNFADMTTGKIKELFIEFLQLYKLAEYEAQSKRAISFYETKLHIASNETLMIENSLEKLKNIDAELKPLLESNKRIKKMVEEGEKIIEDELIGLEELKKTQILNEQNVEKVKELDEQIKKLELEQAQIKRDRILAEDKHSDAILRITNERQVLSSTINQKELIEKASSVLIYHTEREKYFSDCLDCALSEESQLHQGTKRIEKDFLSPLNDKKTKLENDPALKAVKSDIDDNESKLLKAKEKEAALLMKKRQLENDPEKVSLLKDIEIHEQTVSMSIDPDCKSEICPAIARIHESKEELPILKAELEICGKSLSERIKGVEAALKITEAFQIEYTEKIKTFKKNMDTIEYSIETELIQINHNIEEKSLEIKQITSDYNYNNRIKHFYRDSRDDSRRGIESAKFFAEKIPELKVAESKKETLDSQEKEKLSAWLELKAGFDRNFETKILIIAELSEENLRIDARINVTVDVDINISEKLINDKKKESEELKDMESKNNESIAVLNNSLRQKDEFDTKLKKNLAFKKAIEKEISDWTYLKISCSKTGLQALEIDGAAPLITKEGNQLLEMTFGLDFQIKIVTVDPESGKEVFWVMVIRDDGSEDNFELLSGGQKVWIAKALSLGMTLVSNHKSGKAFQELFADENDGALDRDKALDFVGLYRSMMQAGTFDACMYISHNPDVVAMADHVLDFSGDQLVWG